MLECSTDPSDEDWEAADADLDEDFEEDTEDATVMADEDATVMADEEDEEDEDADEDSAPELTTDYLDNPEYTVDPPGLKRKAEAAEVRAPARREWPGLHLGNFRGSVCRGR